jgi:hypothetical protein
MLGLDDPRWSELQHAYGSASDIPRLLKQLVDLPSCEDDKEPWFSIWSSLAHQGDVYSASFAAVPHVIDALASDPLRVDFAYFGFPAWVEICRIKKNVPIPEDLAPAYFMSLARLPNLVAEASSREWDIPLLLAALSAIAVVKGQPVIAEAIQELTPDIAGQFMTWLFHE